MFILTFPNNASFSKEHQRQLLNSKIIMANFCPTSNFLPNVDITHYACVFRYKIFNFYFINKFFLTTAYYKALDRIRAL